MGNVKIIVLHKGDSTAKQRIDSTSENVLQMLFAGIIERVGFAGKNDLNGTPESR
jgi:hypothetical protein